MLQDVEDEFLSTPSVRRATSGDSLLLSISMSFLSTPSARRATGCCHAAGCRGRISIHALREEGDDKPVVGWMPLPEFLSTPSARRATAVTFEAKHTNSDFYPRPPRGGRLFSPVLMERIIEFLSTPSARRATGQIWLPERAQDISIHALREEGDQPRPRPKLIKAYFYPRPPRGGRRPSGPPAGRWRIFLSTPSARRATEAFMQSPAVESISIHALREEGDKLPAVIIFTLIDFYPRPPRGGRRRVLHAAER